MKSGNNIERRGKGGIFYFRRSIPNDLQARVAPRDLRISLRTNLRAEAIAAARRLNVLADRLFDQLRQGKNDMTITNLSHQLELAFKQGMFQHHVGLLEEARDGEGSISLEEARVSAQLAEFSAACFSPSTTMN